MKSPAFRQLAANETGVFQQAGRFLALVGPRSQNLLADALLRQLLVRTVGRDNLASAQE